MNQMGAHATLEIHDRFFALIDSLSALRSLVTSELLVCSDVELAERALVELVKHQTFEFCSIFLLKEGDLQCVAGTGFDEQHATFSDQVVERVIPEDSMRFAVGEGVVGLVYQTGQLYYCSDCSKDEQFKPFDNPEQRVIPGSIIAVPLQFGDEMLGVLNISHPTPGYFEPWHQHMLSLYCRILGQVLHNHQLVNNLDGQVRERTQQLETALRESETLRDRYQHLSMVDGLTGLNNRRYFFPEAVKLLSRSIRYEQSFSLLLLDIDYFKQINDRWGHQVGDEVLKRIANELQSELRQGDIVARLGGEEFILALPNTNIEGADLIAQRIQTQIRAIVLDEDGPVGITVSIGMSELNGRAINHQEASRVIDILYQESDAAMYECKRRGRDRRLVYDLQEISQL